MERRCPDCNSTNLSGGWLDHQLYCEDCGWSGVINQECKEMKKYYCKVFNRCGSEIGSAEIKTEQLLEKGDKLLILN